MSISVPSQRDLELRKFREEQERLEQRRLDQIKQEENREIQEAELQLQKAETRERRLAAVSEEIGRRKEMIGYNDRIARTICKRIADGEMLSAICEDVTMPYRSKVLQWLDDPTLKPFHLIYSQALAYRTELFADQLITIADDSTNDYMDKVNSKTGEKFRALDNEALGRAKMRLDVRLRWLKAFAPDRWGDSPENSEVQRNNSGGAPRVIINLINAAPVSNDTAKIIEGSMPGVQVTRSSSKTGEVLSIDRNKVA